MIMTLQPTTVLQTIVLYVLAAVSTMSDAKLILRQSQEGFSAPDSLLSRALQAGVSLPKCPSTFAWIRDPSDCRRFWRCNWGRAIEMPRCPEGTVLSDSLHVCVFKDSIYDDCSPLPTVIPDTTTHIPTTFPTSMFEFCSRNRTALLADPQFCHKYYNCSGEYGVVPRITSWYLTECPYPLLFDRVREQCLSASGVYCEDRKRPTSSCDYKQNNCNSSPQSTTSTTTTVRPVPIFQECAKNNSALVAYPKACHQYYNCSGQYGVVPRTAEFYRTECAFPLLYDAERQECRSDVDCGVRKRPKFYCDYVKNKCNTTPLTTSLPPSTTPFSIFQVCAKNNSALRASPKACHQYYNCSGEYGVVPRITERPTEHYLTECPFPLLYDQEKEKCQWQADCGDRKTPLFCDYKTNKCNSSPVTSTSQPPSTTKFSSFQLCARNNSALAPSPKACHQYYNCSGEYGVVPRRTEHYLTECAHPLLYHETRQECLSSEMVDCGNRKIPTSFCDYASSSCKDLTTPTRPFTATTPTDAPQSTAFPVIELCSRNSTGLIPNEAECQLYYDCSRPYDQVPPNLEQFLYECPYLQLFDSRSLKCRQFYDVDCQGRKEAVTPCDYRQYQCSTETCTPCDEVFPDCVGKGNGYRAVRDGGNWTGTYVDCWTNRTLATHQCPFDATFNVAMVFSPVVGRCVHLYDVPEVNGGLQPSCAGRSDGAYPDTWGREDILFVCILGQLSGVYICPENRSYFDSEVGACVNKQG